MGANSAIRGLKPISRCRIGSFYKEIEAYKQIRDSFQPYCKRIGLLFTHRVSVRDVYLSVYFVFTCNFCIYFVTGERQHYPWPFYSTGQKYASPACNF